MTIGVLKEYSETLYIELTRRQSVYPAYELAGRPGIKDLFNQHKPPESIP